MRKFLKWFAILLGGLIVILLIVGLSLFLSGNSRLEKTYDISVDNINVPNDAASIAYGKHRVETLCTGCHGENLGGETGWFNAGPLGTVDLANLTSGKGGIMAEFKQDSDYVRAIRDGVDPDGKPLFMPAVMSLQNLSDDDLGAIIAYLRTLPPVDHETNGQNLSPLGKILLATGQLGVIPAEVVSHKQNVVSPPAGETIEYGNYLVDISGCVECHGSLLSGGKHPDPSVNLPVPNITPGGELSQWTEKDFITAMRTGNTPQGNQLSEYMPWKEIGRLNDTELKAMWLYLQSLPARETVVMK